MESTCIFFDWKQSIIRAFLCHNNGLWDPKQNPYIRLWYFYFHATAVKVTKLGWWATCAVGMKNRHKFLFFYVTFHPPPKKKKSLGKSTQHCRHHFAKREIKAKHSYRLCIRSHNKAAQGQEQKRARVMWQRSLTNRPSLPLLTPQREGEGRTELHNHCKLPKDLVPERKTQIFTQVNFQAKLASTQSPKEQQELMLGILHFKCTSFLKL